MCFFLKNRVGIAILLGVTAVSVLRAPAETLWWEAEAAKETNMPVKNDDPTLFSGGQWLTGPVSEGLYADYDLQAAEGGRYTFYARRFWMHGAFRWRIDEGDWYTVQGLKQEIVDQVATPGGPLCWIDLGYVTLTPGAHKLRIEMVTQTDFQFNKVFGFDCFALSNDGFTPKGIDRAGGPKQAPFTIDESQFGRMIPRTMALLASATPEHRTPVFILFYGQSIIGRSHLEVPIGKYLRDKYPNAVITVENLAIGGYEAPRLRKTSWADLYPKNPDLVVFHDYGGETGELEEMFKGMKENMTTEVLTWTHHVDNFGTGIDKQRDASSVYLTAMAAKYGYEMVDVRDLWKEHLKETHLDAGAFLADQIHLNTQGVDLLVSFLVPHFRENPNASDEWKRRVHSLDLSGAAPGVSFDPAAWTQSPDGLTSKGTAPLRIEFTGNRVDLVGLSSGAGAGTGSAKILLDGQAPSTERTTLAASRSTLAPGSWWPALTLVTLADNAVPEKYTLHFHDVTPDGSSYAFDLVGAACGDDGSGKSGADFVSKSGHVSFLAGDVALDQVQKTLKKDLPPQFDIAFEVYSMSRDSWSPPRQLEPGRVPQETVVRCWKDGPHVLEIVPDGAGPIGIREAIVFSPGGES